MLFDVTLLCPFLCRTNPHINEQGGDSAPTFYSSSKLRKSHFSTASPPLGGFGHFCPIAFLSTPAAHRSVQSWTRLPKIGDTPGFLKNEETPADMQQFVNQRAKLRCDFWQPDFRPPDEGSKTERGLGVS